MLVTVDQAGPPAPSVSVVNCYRAVPVVVSSSASSVPSDSHVCSVNIVQTTPESRGRTFTSTEAQTDEMVEASDTVEAAAAATAGAARERRRRERRERRQQRRINVPAPGGWQTQIDPAAAGTAPAIPDILHSHLPPPYTTLPLGLAPPPPPPPPPPPVAMVPLPPAVATAAASPQHHHLAGGMRFPFQLAPGTRRRARGHHYASEEEAAPKSCCGVVVTQTVSIRWFIVMIAFVGLCCAAVGTALGAVKASGRDHLTVSLLMIGVGIVLITVSGVAWRLTAHDAPSCRVMLGLGGGGDDSGAEPNRRFVPRLPPSYGRPHHPYAAMMYPEFQYRPPPPSYQASMQEYRLRLLLLDRHPGGAVPGAAAQTVGGHLVSPPPTYRSHAGSTLSRAPLGIRRDQIQSDYSRPPSYRSRTSSTRPTLDPNGNMGCSTAEHSRDPSLSLSESGGGSAVVNVISVMNTGASETENLDNIKMLPDQDIPLRMMLNKGCHSSNMTVRSSVDEAKDANLVTIVQTGSDSSPVIVTVSGSTMATATSGSASANGVDTEMEILAHL